ncbi:MAG TPA: glycoside hydrolase domain-containing protein, partial [Polyangia bacterium]|nr:glycoside hydrolase domain-containing protein [Polyangia bacterium]
MARVSMCVGVAVAAGLVPASARAATVWAIDDGERIGQAAVGSALATGEGNPVWRPGAPIRLFAMRDEVVAFQIVVEAGAAPLEAVTVDVPPLHGERGGAIRVDRFVEHFFDVTRPSSANGTDHCIGWDSGSGPPPGRYTGVVPDALIPVELAPGWSPWPMRVAARTNGVVWVDLTVPRDQPAGLYRAEVVARAAGRALAALPLELEVLPATMPAWPVRTMLYYGRGELAERVGDVDAAERQLWRLLHAHRLAPIHAVASAADVRRQLPALDGSLYTKAAGYEGPAAGEGDGIVAVGMYGSLGAPTPAALASVAEAADALAAPGLFDKADVILYAEDEVCASPLGAAWTAALARAPDANARRVRVAWTCDDEPARQPVAVPIVGAEAYDARAAAAARAAGKDPWIYGGRRPAAGTLMTDVEAVSLRTLGWIAAMAGTRRWFIWATTAWYDRHPSGHGPFDPFVTAETYHNQDGDALMGDGVLLYPGRQRDRLTNHSLGFPGVLPSIRLKNLRRGVEDAGYLSL